MKFLQLLPLVIAVNVIGTPSKIMAQQLAHKTTDHVVKKEPVRVMIDMDMDTDVDDLGALATLHALADKGEVVILSTTCTTTNNWSAPCINVINTWFNRPDVPVGVLKQQQNLGSTPDWPGFSFNKYLVEHFPNKLKSAKRAPDACLVMRKMLASARQKVIIVAIGGSVNLRYLLDSRPDTISALSGRDLIRARVQFISMVGGGYPVFKQEYNFVQDLESTRRVILNWPTPIYFCGYELGDGIKTGQHLTLWCSPLSPVRVAYQRWNDFFLPRWDPKYKLGKISPHSSWDQTAVLFAIRGEGDDFRFSPAGRNFLKSTGASEWVPDPGGKDRYVLRSAGTEKIAREIEHLMASSPRKPLKK